MIDTIPQCLVLIGLARSRKTWSSANSLSPALPEPRRKILRPTYLTTSLNARTSDWERACRSHASTEAQMDKARGSRIPLPTFDEVDHCHWTTPTSPPSTSRIPPWIHVRLENEFDTSGPGIVATQLVRGLDGLSLRTGPRLSTRSAGFLLASTRYSNWLLCQVRIAAVCGGRSSQPKIAAVV